MSHPSVAAASCRAVRFAGLARSATAITFALAASLLTGCAVLVPESRITPIPKQSVQTLDDAVAFADLVATEFDDTQSQISYTEAGLSVGTLALAAVVGYDVVFARAISTVRAPVLGMVVLQGAETTGGLRSRRDILDAGATALACAKRVAYTMQALPAGVGSEHGVDLSKNPSPMANFARTDQPRAAPLAATAHNVSIPARALETTLRAAPKPVAALADKPAITTVIADAVATNAANMEAANSNATASANQAQLQAPEYLRSTVELVARQVLTQLHASTPSLDAIATAVRTQSKTYLSDAQDALSNSAKSTGTMATALDAAKPLVAQAVQMSGALKIQEDAAAKPAAARAAKPKAAGAAPDPSPAAPTDPDQAGKDAAQGAATTAAQAQATQSTALTVKQLLDFAVNCDK